MPCPLDSYLPNTTEDERYVDNGIVMVEYYTEMSPLYRIQPGEFYSLTEIQKKKLMLMISRNAERAYRRGYHQGCCRNPAKEKIANEMRWGLPLDQSPNYPPFCGVDDSLSRHSECRDAFDHPNHGYYFEKCRRDESARELRAIRKELNNDRLERERQPSEIDPDTSGTHGRQGSTPSRHEDLN